MTQFFDDRPFYMRLNPTTFKQQVDHAIGQLLKDENSKLHKAIYNEIPSPEIDEIKTIKMSRGAIDINDAEEYIALLEVYLKKIIAVTKNPTLYTMECHLSIQHLEAKLRHFPTINKD